MFVFFEKYFCFSSYEKNSRSTFDSSLYVDLAVAGAGIFGVILGVVLVKCNVNRKYLLFSSAFGTVLSFATLGIYYLVVKSSDSIVIPTLCLVTFITIFNMGFGPLCYCMMAELFPDEIQHKAMSIVMVNIF